MLPRFHPKEFHRLIARYRPNVIAGVPSIYEYLLRSDLGKLKLDFLKVAISGGDSLAVSTKRQLDRILRQHGSSARIREGYGLTECVTGSCLMPQESEKEGSIGLPYADTEYRIYDNQHQTALPPGELGEIILRGPTVMQGYLQIRRKLPGRCKPMQTGTHGSIPEIWGAWMQTDISTSSSVASE